MIKNLIAVCAMAVVLMTPCTAQASTYLIQSGPQSRVQPSEALLNRLPAHWREKVRSLLTLTESQQKQLLGMPDEDLRQNIARDITRSSRPEAMEFLLEELWKEPSPKVRAAIIADWATYKHWSSNPKTVPALEKLVTTDPDGEVSVCAIESIRRIKMSEMRSLLTKRLEDAKSKGDQTALKQLADEEERWISLQHGTMLPAFLRVVPPRFSLKPADKSIHFVAFGDFGTGKPEQKKVAQTILAFHKKKKFDFGITLGDNFYGAGMESPSDSRWTTWWEQLYGPLKIKFYASLGNHDWVLNDSPAAEVLYSGKSTTWQMPAPYYTYTAGPVQFFAMDTNEMSERQLLWLQEELAKSTARWKIVYGHHPVYVSSTVGPDYTARMEKQLLPLIRGKVDAYLCGHHHTLQHLKPVDGTHFFVSGGGGQDTYDLGPDELALFKNSTWGFMALEADQKALKVSFIDLNGRLLYEYTVTK